MHPRTSQAILFFCGTLMFLPSLSAQELEVVIVTAQKREESLEDVPISITAISGEEIAKANISNMQSLQSRIPNFKMSTAAVSTEIYIRGVGSGANDGFEQSVGVFVDGVYGGRGRQFRSPFLDLERLEVLRGPQGVLLGKNTIAGAVNITTAKPTDYFTSSITGSFNHALEESRGTLIVSGPLNDSTRGRLAATLRDSKGYLLNTFDQDDEAQLSDLVVRGTLEKDFSDTLSGSFKYEVGKFDVDGTPFVISDVGPFLSVFESYDPRFSLDDYRSSKGGQGGEDEFDNTENTNSVLRFDWDVGQHTLTSITGYSNFKFQRRLDSDFSPISMLLTETLPERFEQLSQELQLVSNESNDLSYIAGLYWQTNEVDTTRQTRIDGQTLADLLSGPLMNPLGSAAAVTTGKTFQKFDQQADSVAVYGQLTWRVSDRVRAILGARYSKEEKDAVQLVRLETLDGNPNTNQGAVAITGLLFGFTNHFFADSRSESDVSPSLQLELDVNDEHMLYLNAARGFKAGGYNAQERGDDIDLFEFEEEKATTFELGLKANYGFARFNVNAFYSEYDDRQVSAFNGVTFVVGNAAASTSKGLEFDGAIAMGESLELGGSFALLDSVYDEFPDGPCFAGDTRPECLDVTSLGARDLSGETTSYAADYSGHVYLRGNSLLSNQRLLTYAVDWTFTDGFFYNVDLDPLDYQEPHGLLGARISYGPEDGKWEVALIGENLTEEITNGGYGSDIPLLTGAHFSTSIAPRRVTLSATVRFGN